MKKQIIIFIVACIILVTPCLAKESFAITIFSVGAQGQLALVGDKLIRLKTHPSVTLSVFKGETKIYSKDDLTLEDAAVAFHKQIAVAAEAQYVPETVEHLRKEMIRFQMATLKALQKKNPQGAFRGYLIAYKSGGMGFARMGTFSLLLTSDSIEEGDLSEAEQKVVVSTMLKNIGFEKGTSMLLSAIGLE